jgi:hypothetical protein
MAIRCLLIASARPLSRPFISIDVLIENAEGSVNPTGLDLREPFTR